jgi:hypothetical protein
MAGYTKEFLVAAFMSRYIKCSLISIEQLESLEKIANNTYDKYGRDKFREYASLTADRIREYKATL